MTETISYTNIDKSVWPEGPWQGEPDKMQWQDEATGLPCLIVRSPMGALCGYVGVNPGHPWYGVDWPDVRGANDVPVEIHGGLTFAGACAHSEDPSRGICHIPAPGAGDDVWWQGFDCGHAWDLIPYPAGTRWPGIAAISSFADAIVQAAAGRFADAEGVTYRDLAFVQQQCASLALQARDAARG